MLHISDTEIKYCHRFVQVGTSFFAPSRDRKVDLGGGLEAWSGFHLTASLGWRPFVTIDDEYIN
jgi:hypothetical protein